MWNGGLINIASRFVLVSWLLWCPSLLTAVSLVTVPGGGFMMGDASGDANERPTHRVVAGFCIMSLEVTNALYAAFIAATGHITDVEKTGAG